jgi:multidrug resistance efflux pump
MDAQTAQLRHQIDQTRAALDATLTQLEPCVSQLPAARATAWLSPYPWLIIAAMALVSYQLHRAKS